MITRSSSLDSPYSCYTDLYNLNHRTTWMSS